MWLWQCTLLLGVMAHHSTGSKSGKIIMTKNLLIIPRCQNSKVCLYTDDQLTVYDPSAHHCHCHEAVQKFIKEFCENNGKNYRDPIKSTSETPHQQNPQSSSPYNQQRPSGPYASRSSQRAVSSNGRSGPIQQSQSSDPTTRSMPMNPQTSDDTQRGNERPNNVPHSERPQRPINHSNPFEQNNQQRLSGPPNTHCQAPSSRPSDATQQPQGQSLDSNNQQRQQSRGQPQALNHQYPQMSNQNNYHHGNAGPSQRSYCEEPQDQSQYPRSLDRNNQQRSPNQPSRSNRQLGGTCYRPTGSSHQPHSLNSSYQQGTQSSHPDRQHQGNSGPINGPVNGRHNSQSLDPNNQQRFSGKRPCSNLNSPAQQQPISQLYDPRSTQISPPSEYPSNSFLSQIPDPSHQRRISDPAQAVGPANRLIGPSHQSQSRNPISRALPLTLNQQHPQSQHQNNQYGGNSGLTSGQNNLCPQRPNTYGPNNPQRSSHFPNQGQGGPGNSQQPRSSDPSNQHHESRYSPQDYIQRHPQPSNKNQYGGYPRPVQEPNNQGLQSPNQYPRAYVPNNQQQLSGPNNSINTLSRSCPTRLTQQPQSSFPNIWHGHSFPGSPKLQNEQYPQTYQNRGNPKSPNMPYSGKPQKSDQRPRSDDSSNQQGRPSNEPSQPLNQQNRQYSDPSRQNRGNSETHGPHSGRTQELKPQSQTPRNHQELLAGAQNDGSTQLSCPDGTSRKPQSTPHKFEQHLEKKST